MPPKSSGVTWLRQSLKAVYTEDQLLDLLARKSFPELASLEALISGFGARARTRVVAEVHYKEKSYPLHSVVLGSTDPQAPAIGFFAGSHGLEKIGSEVVISYMVTLLQLLRWDRTFQERLKYSRLVFMPLINPVGIVHRTRSNGNGIDLMRNSPLNAEGKMGLLYPGHRFSPQLPWYRGIEGAEMEVETKALLDVVDKELLTSRLALSVDVHSGFGAMDRFWFPYAHSRKPFPYLPEAYALKGLLDQTYPHHFYKFEPMSKQYTIHGDPWDHILLESRNKPGHGLFIPFTLEMGSWMWLKKNPLQIFSKGGVFDPVKPHRRNRILRRHLNLFDFLHRSALSPEAWLYQTDAVRSENMQRAMKLWY